MQKMSLTNSHIKKTILSYVLWSSDALSSSILSLSDSVSNDPIFNRIYFLGMFYFRNFWKNF